jgi:hypothetical protein
VLIPIQTEDPPMSHTVIFRVALDVLIGGFVCGLPVYMATGSLKTSTLTGLLSAAKVLQSTLAPSPHQMNVQRQAEKEGGDA